MFFPGIKLPNGQPVPVNLYEWSVPLGWKPRSGDAPTSSGTFRTVTPSIELITDTHSAGEVRVKGVNDCLGSNDFSVYSWPIVFSRSYVTLKEYPQTAPLGEVNTYLFKVEQVPNGLFEWQAPEGWDINNSGTNYVNNGGNGASIKTGRCYTNERVKVRLVIGGNISDWAIFPTTVAVPSIKLPTETMQQYYTDPFSLTMTNDNIASVQWLLNGDVVATETGKSETSLLIRQSGKVEVSAKVLIQGCETYVAIPAIEINVTPNPLVITGSDAICNNALFSVSTLPPGATVQWSASDNRLSLISGQGTAQATFQRTGSSNFSSTINAEVSLFGNASLSITKDVYAGAPQNIRMMLEGNYFNGYIDPQTNQPVSNPHKIIAAEGDVGTDPSLYDSGVSYSDASNWEIVKLTDNFDYEIYSSSNSFPSGLNSINGLIGGGAFNSDYQPKRIIVLKIIEKMNVLQPVKSISFKVRVRNTSGWSEYKIYGTIHKIV